VEFTPMTHFLLAAILAVLLLSFAAVRRGLLWAFIALLVLWAVGHDVAQKTSAPIGAEDENANTKNRNS
jgi:hypothetical protein